MKRNKIISIAVMLALLLGTLAGLNASASTDKKIKVGFSYMQGLCEINEDGTYSGYTYDYLNEIAKYTGWEYEFVVPPGDINESWTELYAMLEDGRIDVIGGTLKNEQTVNQYSFPEFSSGRTYSTLSVLADDLKYNESNYKTFENMRVGILAKAKQGYADFKAFCEVNSIVTQDFFYDSKEEMDEALKNHEIDGVIGNEMNLSKNERIVARYKEKPHYFATTKGNSEVLSGLNAAIGKITQLNPRFDSQLYKKHFKPTDQYKVILSEEELASVRNAGKLRAVYVSDWAPIQYYDKHDKAFRGIGADVLRKIAQTTGLEFEYIRADTCEQALEMMEKGEADLMVGLPFKPEFSQQFNVTLTNSYLTTQTVVVRNNSVSLNDIAEKRLTVPNPFCYIGNTDPEQVQYGGNFYDCLRSVNEGRADFSYANGYTAEYYMRENFLNHISLFPLNDVEEDICIGLAKPFDRNLLSVVNKILLSISEEEIEAIIYDNTVLSDSRISIESVINSHPIESVLVVSLLGVVIMAVIFLIMRIKAKHNYEMAMEGKRYRVLSEMADELMFEYDFSTDSLSVSEEFAKVFRCDRVIENYSQSIDRGKGVFGKDFNMLEQVILKSKPNEMMTEEFRVTISEGQKEWFRAHCTILQGKHNDARQAIGKLKSVDQELKEKADLLKKSQKDALTGLYNRSVCEEKIAYYLSNKEPYSRYALMIIDLDYFKSVNDTLGHQAGDNVLKDLGSRLSAVFRQTDILGRLGGDEFIVFMKDIPTPEMAFHKAEELCRRMDKKIRVQGKDHQISLSVGVVVSQENKSFKELYRQADVALYQAKQNGRNCCKLYENTL